MSTFIERLLLKLYFIFTTHCCRYLMSPLLQTGKLRHRSLGEPGHQTHRPTLTWPFPPELSGILRQLHTCAAAGTRGLGHEEVAGRQGTTCMNGTSGLGPSVPHSGLLLLPLLLQAWPGAGVPPSNLTTKGGGPQRQTLTAKFLWIVGAPMVGAKGSVHSGLGKAPKLLHYGNAMRLTGAEPKRLM